MSELMIQSITFAEDDAIIVTYGRDDWVRKDGALMKTESLYIGAHDDYSDELADLHRKVQELVQDALEDFPTAPVVARPPEGGDDDDEGMGF